MPPRRSKLPLLAGLLASLLIHAWLLLPGLIAVMHGGELYSMTARFTPEEIRPPEEETSPENDTPLGLENGSPSTLTWIGYEEYQEQRAALAQIEQAAFTETPGPRNTSPPDSPAPSTPPVPPAQPTPDQKQPPDQQPTENTPDTEAPPESPTPSETQVPPASPTLPSPFDQVLALLNDLQDTATTPPSETNTPSEKPTPPAAKPEATKKTEPSPPPVPTKPAGGGIPADPSDRESDASSIVEVPIDQMKIGKPLSAKGLEIKTRRPDFTNLQKLTALPGNPLYEIAFDRTGRPRKVKPLELAGDKGIDAAVQASLYRWRAKGKPLQKLGPKQTLKFRIRIMLNRGGRGR